MMESQEIPASQPCDPDHSQKTPDSKCDQSNPSPSSTLKESTTNCDCEDSDFSQSVSEFMKDSSEIQADIQSLTTLCRKLAPGSKREKREKRKDGAGEERGRRETVDFEGLRRELVDAGFGAWQEGVSGEPTVEELHNSLLEVLTELTHLRASDKALYTKFQDLAAKHQSLLHSFQSLHKRIERYKSNPRVCPTVKYSAESEGKPLEVFRNFFNREFRQNSETDTKTMAMILGYENRLKMGKNRSGNSSFDRITEENAGILAEIMALLGTKDGFSTIETVEKMQTVVKSLPKVESFVKEVCFAVYPDLGTNSGLVDYTNGPNFDDIVPTLYEWRHKIQSFSLFQKQIAKMYRFAGEGHSTEQLVLFYVGKTGRGRL